MKRKFIVLSLIVFVIVVSTMIIGYIYYKNPSEELASNSTDIATEDNPLKLCDDFHYMTTTQNNNITTIYYVYKKAKIPVLIEMDEDHFVYSLWVMDSSSDNYQKTIDVACNLVNNVLSSFTDEQKSQIIYNIRNKEYYFDIGDYFFLVSTNSGCEITISPRN